ncbi:hypothetical protein JTB14_034805 [Gonioctena quinquepunctata]|nr:hypothetical protein JTB14_034805 [Gonioctena quinquepunctata]
MAIKFGEGDGGAISRQADEEGGRKLSVKALLFFVPAISAFVFPDDFHKCNLSAENVNDCLTEGIKTALEILGSEEGVTSPINITIEPLYYHNMLLPHNNDFLRVVNNLTDCRIEGLSKSTVSNVRVNPEELILEFSLQTRVFEIFSIYQLDGEIVLLNSTTFSPLYGNGNATHVISGVTSNHTIQATTITVDDVEYLTVKSYNASSTAEHHSVQLSNLYNGEDPKAAALAQAVADVNSQALLEESQADLNRYFEGIFKSYVDKLIRSVPKKDIFVQL